MLSKALEVYFKSVGNNGSLILNISPSHTGKIDKVDVEHLVTLGVQLGIEFQENFAEGGTFTDEGHRDDLHSSKFINSGKSYFISDPKAKKSVITLDMGEVRSINKVVLAENIETGQQIEKFKLYYFFDGKWRKLYSGTTIGRKKICLLPTMDARRLRLVIEKTRNFATLKSFEVY